MDRQKDPDQAGAVYGVEENEVQGKQHPLNRLSVAPEEILGLVGNVPRLACQRVSRAQEKSRNEPTTPPFRALFKVERMPSMLTTRTQILRRISHTPRISDFIF